MSYRRHWARATALLLAGAAFGWAASACAAEGCGCNEDAAGTSRGIGAGSSGVVSSLMGQQHDAASASADAAIFTMDEVRTLQVEINKTAVVRTETPITRVAVGNPDLVDVTLLTEHQFLLVASDKVGATNLIVWHGEDSVSIYEIVVMIPGSELEIIQNALNVIVPEADRVRVHICGKSLVLEGSVENQEILDELLLTTQAFVSNVVNLVRVRGGQQVQLEVTIVEVLRSNMKQLGLGYLTNRDRGMGIMPSGTIGGVLETTTSESDGAMYRQGHSRQGGASGGISSNAGSWWNLAGTVGADVLSEVGSESGFASALTTNATLASPYSSAFQVLLQSSQGDEMAILNLLKGQNLARTLASPTLVALSGQEASFLVGGEFPVPINSEGNEGVSVSYRSYGIMLRFMPTVIDQDTIALRVEPEVSTPDLTLGVASAGVAVPGLRTRRGETTLQLKDGQMFVMAGLLTDNMSQVVSKVPLLGDVPVLGSLFSSKEYQREESELVIVVRVHLVRPLAPSEAPPLPGAGIDHDMTDGAFFLNAPLDALKTERDAPPDGPRHFGESGFALGE